MKKKRPEYTDFPGFDRVYDHNHDTAPWLMYPLILEEYWYTMTGAEQKVMDFIIRQTLGWVDPSKPDKERKTSDRIAWSQFANGVGGKGKGKGTGLSVSQIRRAVVGLEKKGFIKVIRRKSSPCTFHLVLRKTAVDIANENTDWEKVVQEHNAAMKGLTPEM